MKIRTWMPALAACGLLLAAAQAEAALTTYTSAAGFNAATTARSTDSFSDLSVVTSTTSPLARTVGNYGYTASAVGNLYGAGSAADPALSTSRPLDSLTLSAFTGSPQAIGGFFYATGMDGAYLGGSITLTATDASGATSTQVLPNPTTGSFFGFSSTAGITRLVVTADNAAPTLFATVDNLVLARVAAVPEPEAWALLAAGWVLVGATTRRRS